MKRIHRQLEQLSIKPDIDDPNFDDWLAQTDALDFLHKNTQDKFLVIYAGSKSVFINSLFVSESKLEPLPVKDLLKWNCNGYASWEIVETSNHLYIDHRLSYLKCADQIVYIRDFESVPEVGKYVEISHKFTQAFRIHYIRERNAWCHIDENGDIKPVVCVLGKKNKSSFYEGLAVLIKRDFLEQYAALTNSVLVRFFNFTRITNRFMTWQSNLNLKERKCRDSIYYYYRVEKKIASCIRGFQIIPCMDSKENILNGLKYYNKSDREYVDFICLDWKNNKIREHSCSPKQLASYSIESDLPDELSPVFFNPEVLLKYKDDSEKYSLTEHSVSCRDTWNLETYDINEEGQVHTFMIYLSRLPYKEQLHWKRYNEEPKASIFEQSYKNDFLGTWSSEYDPLNSLKDKLRQSSGFLFWNLKDEQLLNPVNYTVTDSKDEWSRDILRLHQLLIEGFNQQWLRETANKLNAPSKHNIQSITLIKNILIKLNYDENKAHEIVKPFRVLNDHRNKLIHSSIEGAKQLKSQAFENHGSLPQHFRQLVAECDHSMEVLIKAFNHIDTKS